MIANNRAIELTEWQSLDPSNCEALRGWFIEPDDPDRVVWDQVVGSRLLDLAELRNGVRVSARSHVGRIRLGGLTVTVKPKLPGNSMLNLLRYAYGFRRLNLLSNAEHAITNGGFEDLLVAQLVSEVEELLARGLRREYVERSEELASPRGKLEIAKIAANGGVVTAALPCRFYPRIEDSPLNQVLKAGLRLASNITSSSDLARHAMRLESRLADGVSDVVLQWKVLERVERGVNRLSEAYLPSLKIIQLLMSSSGISLESNTTYASLPGFLFDMNTFFQQLMSRFLSDHLPGYRIVDEHGLKDMMRYSPQYNPKRRRSPTPRPDFAVFKQQQLVELLDAKYRDLWDKTLPREMLYQLVVYAISQTNRPRSSIVYPSASGTATESRIDVCDPVTQSRIGQVRLVPINLPRIERLLRENTATSRRELQTEAARVAILR